VWKLLQQELREITSAERWSKPQEKTVYKSGNKLKVRRTKPITILSFAKLTGERFSKISSKQLTTFKGNWGEILCSCTVAKQIEHFRRFSLPQIRDNIKMV
jgi:hypothetical protein